MNMEDLLMKTLSINKEERNEATQRIIELSKTPEVFKALWSVVVESENPAARQSAAKHFCKNMSKKKWNQLSDDMKRSLKSSILERILHEQVKVVLSAIIQSAGSIAMIEPDGWPQLFKLIEESISQTSVRESRELGMFLINVLTVYATPMFEVHILSLIQFFSKIIVNGEEHGTPLGYLTILCLKNFVEHYNRKDKMTIQTYEKITPCVLEVVKAQCSRNHVDRAVECLDYFDALLTSYPRIITNNLKNLINNLLSTAILTNNDDVTCRIFSVISSLINSKTKKIANDEEILRMLIQTTFEVISSPPAPDAIGEDNFDVFNGDTNRVNLAVDILDTLSMVVDHDSVLEHVMPILDAAASSDNMYAKKGLFIILGIIIENCTSKIKDIGIKHILTFVKEGLTSNFPILLNGSLFVLARCVSFLMPEMKVYLIDMLNPLLQLLVDFNGRFTLIEDHIVSKIFQILSESCDALKSEMQPALPIMVPVLSYVIKTESAKISTRELAINVLGQLVISTKISFREFFPEVLDILKPFLTDTLSDEYLPIQVQAFDALGTLFSNTYIEGDDFCLAHEVIEVILNIADRRNCGELRSGAYSMVADCALFMKDKMERHLSKIFNLMKSTFESKETLSSTQNSQNDAEKKNKTILMDLQIVEEKEDALIALGKLSYNIGEPFKPYFKHAYEICYALLDHEHQTIRASAVDALCEVYIGIRRAYPNENDCGVPENYLQIITILAGIIREDANVDVAYAALQGIQAIVKDIPQVAITPIKNLQTQQPSTGTNSDLISGVIKSVLTEKTTCQKNKLNEANDSDEDEDEEIMEDDDDENESPEEVEDNYEIEDLMELALEAIPKIGEAVPPPVFLNHINSYQRHILKLLRTSNTTVIRETTTEVLSRCAKILSTNMSELLIELWPMTPTLIRDKVDNIRNNVAYMIAQFIIHGREAMYSYFNEIANILCEWIQKEQHPLVMDNICGAIASMIVSKLDHVPVNTGILDLFFQFLPLREDFEEYLITFKAFNTMIDAGIVSKDVISKMLQIILFASANNQIADDDDAKLEIHKFLEKLSICFGSEKDMLIMSLPEDLRNHYITVYANKS